MLGALGPDGFLATDSASDYASQARLAEHLRERQAGGDPVLARDLKKLKRTPAKRELVDLIGAIHRRISWLTDHAAELSEARRWQDWLAQLARGLYAPGLPFEAADFIAMLESHRRNRALWGFGPEETMAAWIVDHELTPPLAEELRRYQADLRGAPGSMKHQSQSAYQVAVQHVYMLLWFDERDALDANRCWSDRLRADLRVMTGDEKAAWRALFRHIRGNLPAKPAKSWLERAEELLAAVGRDAFVTRFQAWFAPFRSQEPQRLEVAGSHVLRGLLWYAAALGDHRLPPVALALLDTKWKARKNVDKAMVALVAVLQTLRPEEAWPSLLRLQQEWPTASTQVEEFLKETAAGLGITEEELKSRALLKPRLDIGRHAEALAEKLNAVILQIRRPT